MRRLFPHALVVFILGLLITGNAFATTYYIAANGSDSNSGTSNTTPWLHAPGMPNCSSTCAAITPQAGDRFIFRGGDTWHFSKSSATVYIGGSWNWKWSGSSASCNFDALAGKVVRTSCIYIGADQSWYTGGSWVRPILTMDNPLSTSFVANCAYDDDSFNGLNINAGYVQVDNFDMQGNCSESSPNAAFTGMGGTPVEWSNSYFHGWTVTSSGNAGGYSELGCGGSGCSGFSLFDHNVMDGSDSSGASTPYTGSQKGMNMCTDVEFNVIRYVSNFCVDSSGTKTVHDNLFEYLYNPAGGHGNVVEMGGGTGASSSRGSVYAYNNVFRHSGEGVAFDFQPGDGYSVYFFNNVVYDIGNGGNCLGMGPANSGSTPNTMYVYNNTFDFQVNVQGGTNGGCKVRSSGGSMSSVIFQNNHFINYSPQSISSVINGSFSYTDKGNELWQSESVANSQGYTEDGGYAPTCGTSSCSTVGAANNNYSLIPTFTPSNSAYGSGTSVGVSEISYGGGYGVSAPAIPVNPRQSTAGSCTIGTPGCWDAGAYQFASASTNQPTPPTGLAAVVQ